jgi:hypothetical protein
VLLISCNKHYFFGNISPAAADLLFKHFTSFYSDISVTVCCNSSYSFSVLMRLASANMAVFSLIRIFARTVNKYRKKRANMLIQIKSLVFPGNFVLEV